MKRYIISNTEIKEPIEDINDMKYYLSRKIGSRLDVIPYVVVRLGGGSYYLIMNDENNSGEFHGVELPSGGSSEQGKDIIIEKVLQSWNNEGE